MDNPTQKPEPGIYWCVVPGQKDRVCEVTLDWNDGVSQEALSIRFLGGCSFWLGGFLINYAPRGAEFIPIRRSDHSKLAERKTVHEWLNQKGVPAIETTGKPMCLLRRLAVALGVAQHLPPEQPLRCACPVPLGEACGYPAAFVARKGDGPEFALCDEHADRLQSSPEGFTVTPINANPPVTHG